MKILFDETEMEIDSDEQGRTHGSDVRAKLQSVRSRYKLWRVRTGHPDEMLLDTMEVFSGDVIYATPECFMA